MLGDQPASFGDVSQAVIRLLATFREGDPVKIVSDASLVGVILGWIAEVRSFDSIVRSAWLWHSR